MTKMLLDLEFGKTRDHPRERDERRPKKLADREDMCTPHNNDEQWAGTCSEILCLSTMSMAEMSWTRIL